MQLNDYEFITKKKTPFPPHFLSPCSSFLKTSSFMQATADEELNQAHNRTFTLHLLLQFCAP